ncbi:MAG: cell division protein SepF [Synergistales bacterium]
MWEKFLAFLGLIEEEDDYEDEEELRGNEWEERKKRVFQPAIGKPAVILVRGQSAIDRKDDLLEALRMGQMLILDLRPVDLEPGQGLLDFVCGAVYSTQGKVVRVAPGVFLATPHSRLLETWESQVNPEEADHPEEAGEVGEA